MKMIVGLGNPGKEYINTRHNIGFMIIDHFAESDQWKKKFDGLYQIVDICGEKTLLLKPQTFMNLSGKSVAAAAKFYDILPEDILVIHDDMDLELFKIRLKINSSSGGHNGIKSIIDSLNTNSFARFKIGIAHNKNVDTVDYVLGKFSKSDLEYFEKMYEKYNEIIECFINNGIGETMSRYN